MGGHGCAVGYWVSEARCGIEFRRWPTVVRSAQVRPVRVPPWRQDWAQKTSHAVAHANVWHTLL